MTTEQIAISIITFLMSVCGFFLKYLYADFKKMQDTNASEKSARDKEYYGLLTKVEVIENNNKHLTERFDEIQSSLKELTNEIKHLSLNLERNKPKNNNDK